MRARSEHEPGQHLVSQQQNSLKRKMLSTIVEEVFQRRAQQVDHKDVVVPLRTEPLDARDAV